MISKNKEKELAISLRRKGLTYSEILKKVPVAKSTLSLWLGSVGLSKKQKQKITKKRLEAGIRGGIKRREDRIKRKNYILKESKKDINNLNTRDLWLMGIMIYWGEGTKEKDWRPGSSVEIINSDPYMLKLFLKWLKDIIKIKNDRIVFKIYIHENNKDKVNLVKKYWSNMLGVDLYRLNNVYFKRHKIRTKRKNIGNSYNGIMSIRVKASSDINRKIEGWIKAINEYYWGVV